MNNIVLLLLFMFSGFFMKYSDDFFDEKNNLIMASIFGLLCGIFSAIACISDVGAAYIFIAILCGNLIALKVDGWHHIIALVVFVVICIIFGIPNISLVVLLICILAAFGDEVGHELIAKNNKDTFLGLFFEYRFVMKIVVFLLAIFNAFDILTFVYFMLFEISYNIAGLMFEKVNQ